MLIAAPAIVPAAAAAMTCAPDVGNVAGDPHAGHRRSGPSGRLGYCSPMPDGCASGASPSESRTAERASIRGATTSASSGTEVPSASRAPASESGGPLQGDDLALLQPNPRCRQPGPVLRQPAAPCAPARRRRR